MEYSGNGSSDVDSWKEVILVYKSALKEIGTKLEILNDEFQHVHQYNPIEHIKSRIKTSESIVKKLKRHGYESTIDNMIKYVNDIAGIRIICSFTTDIYRIAEMLERQTDMNIISVKDYIKMPKASGYKSYHMIVSIPIYLSEKRVDAKVEIQIRTVAMDFWASLEHKIYYKFEGNAPRSLEVELKVCAEIVDMLDGKMFSLNESIMKISGEQSGAENRPDERRPDKWTGLLTGGAQEEAPGGLEGSAGDCIAERDTAQEALKEQDPDGV